jgi:hypothetical protein
VAGRGTLEIAARAPSDPPGPTEEPTSGPTSEPTSDPTSGPTSEPTGQPTEQPTGSPGDQQAVATAAEEFYHSLAAKDGERTCALMTAAAQRETSEGGDCAAAVREASLTSEQAAALSRIQIDPDLVQVQGERAIVPARAASVDGQSSTASGEMEILREDGAWKINDITS